MEISLFLWKIFLLPLILALLGGKQSSSAKSQVSLPAIWFCEASVFLLLTMFSEESCAAFYIVCLSLWGLSCLGSSSTARSVRRDGTSSREKTRNSIEQKVIEGVHMPLSDGKGKSRALTESGQPAEVLQSLEQWGICVDASTYKLFLLRCTHTKNVIEGTNVHLHIIWNQFQARSQFIECTEYVLSVWKLGGGSKSFWCNATVKYDQLDFDVGNICKTWVK
jgi:hypothetical protein